MSPAATVPQRDLAGEAEGPASPGSAIARLLRHRHAPPFLLLLPAIVVIVAVVLLPLLFSLYSSFTAYRLTDPSSLGRWTGLTNYERLLRNDDFWWAFLRTVVFLTIALNLELVLGLGLALLLNKVSRGRRVIRTVVMFPMMFSSILVGFQFKYIFNDNIGILNNALEALGYTGQPIAWLVDGTLANLAILTAEVWMSTSIFAILLLAGLMTMPKDPLEAARVDGCNAWQSFRHITLPFLMPFIFIAMTIRSLDVGRAFDVVKIMTNGGPAQRTELLWTLMARVGYQDGRMGMANAMSYVSILLSIAFTVYFFNKLAASRRHLDALD